jgi:hypothetical protein
MESANANAGAATAVNVSEHTINADNKLFFTRFSSD